MDKEQEIKSKIQKIVLLQTIYFQQNSQNNENNDERLDTIRQSQDQNNGQFNWQVTLDYTEPIGTYSFLSINGFH